MYRIISLCDSDSLLLHETEELLKQVLWLPLGIDVSNRKKFFPKAIEKFYVAVTNMNDKLIGCIVIAPIDQFSLEIRHLAVKKEFQNRGIGKSLVNKVLQEWPHKTIEVIVRDTSIEFWEALGFAKFSGWADHPEFLKHGIRFHLYKKV